MGAVRLLRRGMSFTRPLSAVRAALPDMVGYLDIVESKKIMRNC
jgi:hypothetical protein